jgi:hypothetical protein
MTDVKDMLGFSDDDDDLSSSSSSRRGMPPPPHVSHSMRAAGRMPSLDGATKKKVKKGAPSSLQNVSNAPFHSQFLKPRVETRVSCLFLRNALNAVCASRFLLPLHCQAA